MNPNSPNSEDLDKVEKQNLEKKDTKFFSDTLKLVTGSGFVQVFRMLISPVLSRLFLPEYFGILQNYLSIAKPLGLISSLRYDRAVVLPKEDKYAANMLVLSLSLNVLTSSSLFILVDLYRVQVSNLLNSPELADFLWFIPLSVAALGIFEALKQWNSRERKYMRVSIAQVGSEVLGDGLTAGFGFAGFTSGTLMIIMQVIGQVFATLAFGYMVFREDLKFIRDSFDWKIIKQGIVEYKKLPLFNLWSNLINNAALYIPSILLSAYFSTTVAGYYAMGNNAIRLPVSIFGNSIGQVFYQRSAKAYHEGGNKPIMEGTLKYLSLISFFPMMLIAIIGRELFVVVFGNSWADAGSYSQILSLWVFLVFMTTPLSYIPNVYGKYEKFLLYQIINLITRVGSLVYGGMRGDVWLALWLFTLSGIVVYAAMLFWITGLTGVKAKQTFNYLLRGFTTSLPFLLIILAFKLWNPVPHATIGSTGLPLDYVVLLLVSVVCALAYFYIYLLKNDSIKREVYRIVGIVRSGRSK
jgi:O-antigen/teichoic acid export membrane protein